MKAFQIKVDGKYYDYRIGQEINLEEFSKHLSSNGYSVNKLWHEKRHSVGLLEKDGQKLFVKLATSDGISINTVNEFKWNEKFNTQNLRTQSDFWVPLNYDSGEYINYFYLITDFLEGELLAERPIPGYELPNFRKYLEKIIDYSEFIQNLDIGNLEPDEQFMNISHSERFLKKAEMWLKAIPEDVINKYRIIDLFEIVEVGYKNLERKSRHGDYAPWHIFKLSENRLALFDGEHAISNGVELYDIAYFIQRVYSVLENQKLTLEILEALKERNYDFKKLKIVLASRAIGGFLDRSFHKKPNYKLDLEFKNLVLKL